MSLKALHPGAWWFALIGVAALACAPAMAGSDKIQKTYSEALQAESKQDWQLAKELYVRALADARDAGSAPEMISAITYNLGRMTGYTCDFDQAEKLLTEALSLEQRLARPNAGNITKRWSELARISEARRDYEAAVRWYALAVPELERLGVARQDPLGFAAYLEDYAKASRRAGREEQAESARARAEALRQASQGRKQQFSPVRYEQVCAAK